MSAKSALILGIGLGVFPVSQLLGVACVWAADRLTDRHYRCEGLAEWGRRATGWGD